MAGEGNDGARAAVGNIAITTRTVKKQSGVPRITRGRCYKAPGLLRGNFVVQNGEECLAKMPWGIETSQRLEEAQSLVMGRWSIVVG